MTDDRKILWAVMGTVGLVVSVIFFSERVQQKLRPDPIRAFVAIQVEGDDHARVGPVEIAAGQEFRLHAVLEAIGRRGRQVFFTEAPALEIFGRRFTGESLRRWSGPEKAKVLWFSVEGPRPFIELPVEVPLSKLAFKENFRADWPRAWSIPGSLRPAREAAVVESRPVERIPFGTQRFHVRIELFGTSSQLVPAATHSSLGATDLAASVDEFPAVVATLPGTLALPSRVFGLPQIDLASDAQRRESVQLKAWYDADLAFSNLLLLRAMVDAAGAQWDDLEWRSVELATGPPWGPGSVAAGDLLRVGQRVVVLFEDRGEIGRLDYEDLCLDFLEGAQIRRLSEVFSGEGLVESTALSPT
ncbi:MAG: hypothetical protein O7A98_05650 [Acidobacteria bacterium]|nr:hypothetical protein [Acidobacteriota bacterium]